MMIEKLQADIDSLRAELSKIESSEASAERFQDLKAAIDRLQKDADLEQRREVNEQLNQVVTNFEIDDPVIHGLLRNVMKTLADIGI